VVTTGVAQRRPDAKIAIASVAWLICSAFGLSFFLDFVARNHVSRDAFIAIQLSLALLVFVVPGCIVDRKNLFGTLQLLLLPRRFSLAGTCALLAYFVVVLSRYPHRAQFAAQHMTLFHAIWALSLVLIEEVTFRIFLLTILLRVLRPALAITASGFVFGLAHIPAAFSHHVPAHSLLVYLAQVTIFGFALGIAALEFKSIWPGVVAHWLNNMLL
jgi:membrane protease YdiL (CAAX protease family)